MLIDAVLGLAAVGLAVYGVASAPRDRDQASMRAWRRGVDALRRDRGTR